MMARKRIRARSPDINQGLDSPGIDVEEGASGRGAELKKMDRSVELDAVKWQLLQAFRQRAISIMQDGDALRLRFRSQIDAEQCLRLIQSGRNAK